MGWNRSSTRWRVPEADRPAPRVRVLVVNYNSGTWLMRCLRSLAAQTEADFEAVVVDNASTDASRDTALPDRRFSRLTQPRNLGFASANNLAAQGARTPWLALLNPDAIAAPDWLEQLLAEVARHPDAVIVGSTQIRAEDERLYDGTGDCLSLFGFNWRSGYGRPREETPPAGEVFAACGAAMLIRRDWFERLGGFEEALFCYVEDLDLCFRARLQGARIIQSANAQVLHAGGASSAGSRSPFALYHGNRNLIWVLLRCMPQPWLWMALPGSLLGMLLRLLRHHHAAQRQALYQALRDALRGARQALQARRSIQAQRRVSARTVLRWLSLNPIDAVRRRCVLIGTHPKKTPGHQGRAWGNPE